MPKKSPAPAKEAKPPQLIPDWAKQVKALREEAGITQTDLQKAFGTKYNVISPVENGRRKLTPSERKQFFEIIGKPEDPSIPTSERRTEQSTPKKASTAKPKAKRGGKAANPAKKSTKAAKAPKAPRKVREPLTFTTADTVESAVVPVPEIEPMAQEAPAAAPKPRGKRGPKAAPAASLEATEPQEEAPAAPAPKTRKPRKVKTAEAVPTPTHSAAPVQESGVSAVKEAVVRDITRILSSPNLSDSQAKAIHSLFTSLAVNALLGL